MTWVAVHMISYLEFLGDQPQGYTVMEDVYLMEAHSSADLEVKIDKLMKEISDSELSDLSDRKTRLVCVGPRVVRSIYDLKQVDLDKDPPNDGSEITHIEYRAKSIEDIVRYTKGEGSVQPVDIFDERDRVPDKYK